MHAQVRLTSFIKSSSSALLRTRRSLTAALSNPDLLSWRTAEPSSRSWPRSSAIFQASGSSFTAAERTFQGLLACHVICRLQLFFDIKQPLASAQTVPLADKAE